MYIYVYIYNNIYFYIYIYISHTGVKPTVWMHGWMHVCMCASVFVFICMCRCSCAYECMVVLCARVCMCVHV